MWLPNGTLMAILHACRWAVPYGMWLPKGAHRLVFEAHRPLVLSIREGGEQLRVVAARLDISLLGKARCNQSAIRLISEAHQRGSSEKAGDLRPAHLSREAFHQWQLVAISRNQ